MTTKTTWVNLLNQRDVFTIVRDDRDAQVLHARRQNVMIRCGGNMALLQGVLAALESSSAHLCIQCDPDADPDTPEADVHYTLFYESADDNGTRREPFSWRVPSNLATKRRMDSEDFAKHLLPTTDPNATPIGAMGLTASMMTPASRKTERSVADDRFAKTVAIDGVTHLRMGRGIVLTVTPLGHGNFQIIASGEVTISLTGSSKQFVLRID
jgi:hypothetical protein